MNTDEQLVLVAKQEAQANRLKLLHAIDQLEEKLRAQSEYVQTRITDVQDRVIGYQEKVYDTVFGFQDRVERTIDQGLEMLPQKIVGRNPIPFFLAVLAVGFVFGSRLESRSRGVTRLPRQVVDHSDRILDDRSA
jgi:hypothetical protein